MQTFPKPWSLSNMILDGTKCVATYPSTGGRRGAHRCIFQGRKTRGVSTNVYLRKMLEKTNVCGVQTLSMNGSGVVFKHGEDICTPRVRHKGRQPLIECANMTSKLHIFPLLCFMYFPFFMFFFFCFLWAFLYFFIFLWSTRVFP